MNAIIPREPVDGYDHDLGNAINKFHDNGGLWVEGNFLTLDTVFEAVFWSDEYGEWSREQKGTKTPEDLERFGKALPGILATLMNQEIRSIAERYLEQEQEDAA